MTTWVLVVLFAGRSVAFHDFATVVDCEHVRDTVKQESYSAVAYCVEVKKP